MNKMKIKDNIDKIIYETYNLISKVRYIFKFQEKSLIKENIKFKDIHKNDRCFILGTGPSLKELNPDLIKNEITFGVNYLVNGDIINAITPTYYGLFDNKFSNENIQITKSIINKLPNTEFFMSTGSYKAMKEVGIEHSKINYLYANIYPAGRINKIELTNNMRVTYNVVPACIQIALYMGFKEIYLLGTDFNSFATQKPEHYYEDGFIQKRQRSLGEELKEYAIVCNVHYYLDKYAKSKGVKIINLTPNSLLDAYEKKQIKDIIN